MKDIGQCLSTGTPVSLSLAILTIPEYNVQVAADYEGQQQGEVNLFKVTVEALELDGIHLLNPEKAAQEEAQVEEEASNAEPQVTRRLSLKEIFAMERERTSNLSDKTPSDDNIK